MRISFLIGGALLVASTACEPASEPRVARLFGPSSITADTVQTLVVSPNFVELAVATSAQLSTNATTSRANALVWSSTQPSIASVSSTGVVKGISPGTATIVVRYSFDPANSASATVVVAARANP